MHRSNNTVIMQTEQLGRIEALEEELRSSRAKMVEMEQKVMEQDRVIAQLVSDNLEHLQDNMRLTAHINSSNERLLQMEHKLGQVGSVVMGFLEGVMIFSNCFAPCSQPTSFTPSLLPRFVKLLTLVRI